MALVSLASSHVLLLATTVPCSWGYSNLLGQGDEGADHWRLRGAKHKSLCFNTIGTKWECLAANNSSGEALVFIWYHNLVWSMCYKYFWRSVGILVVDTLCTAQLVRDVVRVSVCLLFVELVMPSAHAVFSSPCVFSCLHGGALLGEIYCLKLCLISFFFLPFLCCWVLCWRQT